MIISLFSGFANRHFFLELGFEEEHVGDDADDDDNDDGDDRVEYFRKTK